MYRHAMDHEIPIFTICPELLVFACANIIVSCDHCICLSPKMHLPWTPFDSEVKYYMYCALLVRSTINLKIFFNGLITIETEIPACDLYLPS